MSVALCGRDSTLMAMLTRATPLSAVFLDRDGVINRKAPEGEYVTSWSGFQFLPGALEGLRRLAASPMALVVVTNQRGVARGRMTEDDLTDIHRRMSAAVTEAGGRLDAIYHCPHEGGCDCRKPEVGMFRQAAAELGLDLSGAVMVGDSASDMEAARRIGALGVLVGAGAAADVLDVDHVAPDLATAARWLTPDRA
jgi:D-glycero-D-manno-heptose 1,7-bisphosphate phosphatase